MTPSTQIKLLRVLQEKCLQRLGGKETIPDLVNYFLGKYAAELGVENPSIQPQAVDLLRAQDWAGNVRELENVVRKVLLLAQGYTISLDHIHEALTRSAPPVAAAQQTLREYVDRLLAAAQRGELDAAHARLMQTAEKEIFGRAIELARGNQAKAARWLGISRLTMREKLHQFGLHPKGEGE